MFYIDSKIYLKLSSIKNTINQNQIKTKSNSTSKFYVYRQNSNEGINTQNEIIQEKEYKEITPKKSKRLSVYGINKVDKQQNLPYVSTLSTQAKNSTNKKFNNNYLGKYNIIPLVLPFIGVNQDEKKNKFI